jgi:hypothetical protein
MRWGKVPLIEASEATKSGSLNPGISSAEDF